MLTQLPLSVRSLTSITESSKAMRISFKLAISKHGGLWRVYRVIWWNRNVRYLVIIFVPTRNLVSSTNLVKSRPVSSRMTTIMIIAHDCWSFGSNTERWNLVIEKSSCKVSRTSHRKSYPGSSIVTVFIENGLSISDHVNLGRCSIFCLESWSFLYH